MTLTIELPDAEVDRLREKARELGVRPEDLAAAAVLDLLHRQADDFEAAAQYVLRKNQELYRRLA